MNFYSVYRTKDDSVVATGTAKQCAKQLGFTNEACFYCMISRAKSGKNRKYAVVTEHITPEEYHELRQVKSHI